LENRRQAPENQPTTPPIPHGSFKFALRPTTRDSHHPDTTHGKQVREECRKCLSPKSSKASRFLQNWPQETQRTARSHRANHQPFRQWTADVSGKDEAALLCLFAFLAANQRRSGYSLTACVANFLAAPKRSQLHSSSVVR